jgi:DNA polymerase III alpha subunit
MRAVFGPFISMLDFLRRMEPQQINRRELQVLIRLGAFSFTSATLFQVAQSDPDYLRSLALTAQRPQVRAAALQLVRALEASQQAPRRRRTPKTNSRRHDG